MTGLASFKAISNYVQEKETPCTYSRTRKRGVSTHTPHPRGSTWQIRESNRTFKNSPEIWFMCWRQGGYLLPSRPPLIRFLNPGLGNFQEKNLLFSLFFSRLMADSNFKFDVQLVFFFCWLNFLEHPTLLDFVIYRTIYLGENEILSC